MRETLHPDLEAMRYHPIGMPRSPVGAAYGAFMTLPGSSHSGLRIISSGSTEASDWEHVSVSLTNRCPNWKEMCYVKTLFWEAEETVVQFHPRVSEYKNDHQNCLHLWKKRGSEFELPPNDHV